MAKHEVEARSNQSAKDSSSTMFEFSQASSAEDCRRKIVAYDPSRAYLQSSQWLLRNAASERSSLIIRCSDAEQAGAAGYSAGSKFNCRYCLELFGRSESVTEHILAEHIPVEAQFGCGCCGTSFEFEQEALTCWRGHQRNVEDSYVFDMNR